MKYNKMLWLFRHLGCSHFGIIYCTAVVTGTMFQSAIGEIQKKGIRIIFVWRRTAVFLDLLGLKLVSGVGILCSSYNKFDQHHLYWVNKVFWFFFFLNFGVQ